MNHLNSNVGLNKEQFESLFRMHFKHLCNFANQYVNDSDAAQDVCQKVFVSLWEKRTEMNPENSIKSYLFTSVKNRCLNHIRDNKKFRSKVLDLECANFEVAEEKDDFAEEDLKNKIERALNLLPEKCRMVFEMSRFQNMKYREIAEELGLAQKTVEAHMSKAIKTLRLELKEFLTVAIILWLITKGIF